MGAQVEGVPRRARVGAGPSPARIPTNALGSWLRAQRQLRGVSVYFVSGRTGLSPRRVLAIEEGHEVLGTDAEGRRLARALARSIGASAREAVLVLLSPGPDSPAWPVRRLLVGLLRRGAGLASLFVASTPL